MTPVTHMPRPRGRPPIGKAAQTSSVQALDRALGLLEILADNDGLSLTELAQRAEMAPSTAHRLLTTLQARRFVDLDREHTHWFIGVRAFQVGNGFVRNRKLITLGRVIMRALMEKCGETVNLGIVDEGEVVFVSQFESHAPMRAFFRPGRRGPIHASGIGKALMATWPKDIVLQIVQEKGLARFTDKTITKKQALLMQLGKIRKLGWSVDDEEHTLGMRCIAAPVYNDYGEAIAGISISGPTVRLPDKRVAELGPEVRAAADEITRSTGGDLPNRGDKG